MGKKRDKPSTEGSRTEGPFNSALAAGLAGLQAVPKPAAPPASEAPSDECAASRDPAGSRDPAASHKHTWLDRRLVVRHERKGRGGKTATLLQGLEELEESQRREIARELARALGCRGTCEEGVIVLSGDLRTRLTAWLTAQGAARVVSGS